jgi:hypothetical protein
MDTREDRYFYGLDQADRPRPRYTAEETARFNALMAEKDAHRAECPMGQCGTISTLCVCAELQKAEEAAAAEECLRCHQFVDSCRCGAKAQWV